MAIEIQNVIINLDAIKKLLSGKLLDMDPLELVVLEIWMLQFSFILH